jgi:voltage-gated potassium channel
MILPVTLSLGVVAFTILLHGFGSSWIVKYLFLRHDLRGNKVFGKKKGLYILSCTAVFLMMLHFTELSVWALIYLALPDIGQLSSFEEAIYFSMVTYTGLGYGDITLASPWRIMSGFEAMNGILLFGWSTAMFFSAVQRMLAKVTPQENEK